MKTLPGKKTYTMFFILTIFRFITVYFSNKYTSKTQILM